MVHKAHRRRPHTDTLTKVHHTASFSWAGNLHCLSCHPTLHSYRAGSKTLHPHCQHAARCMAAGSHGRWYGTHSTGEVRRCAGHIGAGTKIHHRWAAALALCWWCCNWPIRRKSLLLLVEVAHVIIAEVLIIKVLALVSAPVAIQRARRQVRRPVRLHVATGFSVLQASTGCIA